VKILWVVPRWGGDIVGGAETLARALAERGAAMGWDVAVATTCARDHATWENELPPGETHEGGVCVHRFAVAPRDVARHDALHAAVVGGRASYADELEWLSQGVWSAQMQEYLEDPATDHDLRIFAPYLFGTTVWGAQALPARSALMPCLHDEPYAHLGVVGRTIEAVRGCMFNAPAEEALARRLYRVRDGGVVGMGFDSPAALPEIDFAERHGIEGPYLLYAGRLEEGKRVHVAVEYALRLGEERAEAPALVLAGRGGYRAPREARGRVIEVGYLGDDEKRAAHAGALALVNPSEMESLSLVVMESWLEGTPVIVAHGSEVMRDHVERSRGGIAFADYASFRDAVETLLRDPQRARAMGERGRTYVLDEYGWPAVSDRMAALVERLAA
jgi:glycosyltransferase involved in cell wall biosynthesis